jgi:hypothetical protein
MRARSEGELLGASAQAEGQKGEISCRGTIRPIVGPNAFRASQPTGASPSFPRRLLRPAYVESIPSVPLSRRNGPFVGAHSARLGSAIVGHFELQVWAESRPTGVAQGAAGIGWRPGIRRYAVSPHLRPNRSFVLARVPHVAGQSGTFRSRRRLICVAPDCVGRARWDRPIVAQRPFLADHCATAASNSSASVISGISGVGEKPSRAGASTSWAPAGRPVDW